MSDAEKNASSKEVDTLKRMLNTPPPPKKEKAKPEPKKPAK